jgi:hypothetical protein
MSGFNFYIRNYINSKILAVTPLQLFGTTEDDLSAGSVIVHCQSANNTINVEMRWGYSPTAMLYSITRDEAAVAGTTHTFTNAVPTLGQVIYYKMYDLTANSLIQLGTGRITVTA